MDQLARLRAPRGERHHLQRCHGQGRPQVDLQRPADDAAAAGVEDHGKKGKLLASNRRYVMSATHS
jgi:hypothetical protein